MSTGLHARRATGLTVAKWEESFTRTESVVRWSRDGRAAYEAKRDALLFVLFVLDRRRVQGVPVRRKLLLERGQVFFFFPLIITNENGVHEYKRLLVLVFIRTY